MSVQLISDQLWFAEKGKGKRVHVIDTRTDGKRTMCGKSGTFLVLSVRARDEGDLCLQCYCALIAEKRPLAQAFNGGLNRWTTNDAEASA